MVLDMLLAVGLLLSTASQLRPVDDAVGPGEICLAVWVFLMISREIGRLGPTLSPPFCRLMIFWLLFAVAQCIGTMTGFATGDRHDTGLFAHDVVAYVLTAATSCLSVVEPGANARMRRVAWLSVTLGAAWLALQVAFGWGWIDPGSYDTWEWERFRGFSDNANQLALYCAVISLISLHLADTARGFGEWITAVICMIVAIFVGRLTMSDAYLLVLVVAGPVFVVLKLWRWLMSSERHLSLRSAFAWVLVLALPLAAAYVTPVAATVANDFDDLIKGMTKGGGGPETQATANLRFELWKGAVARGIRAGMLGLGPGPHLEIPPSIVAGRRDSTNDPKHVEHPEYGIVPNFEAHNTLLDLFIQGGLIAVLSLGWLVGTALVLTYRAKFDALTTSLCGLAVFSVFHLIVRHPIFWLAVSICLVAAANPNGASNVRVRS